MLESIALWLKATLMPYGGIGMMVLAICDSSFISLPEVNDLLLMTLSIKYPEETLKFSALTTIGSVIGCSLLYIVGRKGGGKFMLRRFGEERLRRVCQWYAKYGMLAVIVPSILPPPTPFKIFVLSAGTFGMSWPRFLIAATVGRSVRYFSEGFLAAWYGEAAIDFVKQNFGIIGICAALLIVAGALIWVAAGRRKARSVVA
jgi:membrane protein YqaA with SNARE-associated domain